MKTLRIPLEPTEEQRESTDLNIEVNRYVHNIFGPSLDVENAVHPVK